MKRFNLHFKKILCENFGIKVFALFTILIFLVSFSFTAFFTHNEGKFLTDTLIKDGKLLARILAYNVRIGVFSENQNLLKDPVEGVFQVEDVLEVSIFNLKGNLLKKQQRPGAPDREKGLAKNRRGLNEVFEKLKDPGTPFYIEACGRLEFWSPVISGSGYFSEDSPFLEQDLPHWKKRVIGFIRVTLDKEPLNKQLDILLFKSVLIGIIFLLIGSGITYLLVKGITKPLNRLTESVKALAMEGIVEKVTVETEDEIGKLAEAFNDMADSLRKRGAEKQALEEQLRHSQKMEAIGTLSGGIAHDLNNILTVILGFGNLLAIQVEENSPWQVKIKEIVAAGKRASTLTQSLLAFSRKQVLTLRQINLNDGINAVKKLLVRLIREDIEIKVKLTAEDLPVMVDPVQIDQILMNLATNARDAMPDGGVLIVATESVELNREFFKAHDHERPGPYALLSVSDTGSGLDQETREKIFDPFFTTKGVGKGTGLGLSMIYGIVKQHEGYIEVHSKPGEGTTFRIYLPLIKPGIEEKKPEILNSIARGTETILIAEDNDQVRTLSEEILAQYGYRTIAAADGEDALKKFMENRGKIQLLLLDVIMPKKNGVRVYEEIKRIRPDIKALFISGHTFDIIHERGIVDKGTNFISKPFSPAALLRKIREILDK